MQREPWLIWHLYFKVEFTWLNDEYDAERRAGKKCQEWSLCSWFKQLIFYKEGRHEPEVELWEKVQNKFHLGEVKCNMSIRCPFKKPSESESCICKSWAQKRRSQSFWFRRCQHLGCVYSHESMKSPRKRI